MSRIRIVLEPSNDSTVTMVTTLSDQGKPVQIKRPAEASVREADDMYYK